MHPFGGSVTKAVDRVTVDAVVAKSGWAHYAPTWDSRFDAILFWAFLAGLAWCPFLFGSVTLGNWGINAIIFCGLAGAYETSLLVRGRSHPIAVVHLTLPVSLFGAVVIFILLQNATWSPAGLHHPIWGMAQEVLDHTVHGSISVNRDMTWLALLRLVTAAAVFWLALQLCRDPVRADFLMLFVGVTASGYAAYGLISYFVAPTYVLWFDTGSAGFVRSTFINRNTYATYGGMGFLALSGIVLRLYRRQAPGRDASIRYRLAGIIEASGGGGALALGGALLVLVSVLMTASRAGITSTIVALFILVLLMMGARKHGRGNRLETVIFAVVLIVGVFAFFSDKLVDRLSELGVTDDTRFAAYTIIMSSILEAPILGYGYGTFRDVFPLFRDRSVSIVPVWEMAHSTYLEIFQGLGVIFGATLVGCVILLTLRCVRGAVMRLQSNIIPAVGASAAVLVGIHALVDFSLQIQAIALTFAALLGAGVAQSTSSRVELARR